ncbi:hypothetical protein M0R04_01745 [Candidatus Dojkabacteria bacterium]|jgi:DNA-directed RNA polymerase subunit F|nr:hypothetical protein [Candidatus Dojkabacteria bacterium]
MENITLKQIRELLEEREVITLKKVGDLLDKKLDERESRIIQKVIEALDYRFDQNDRDHYRMFKEIYKICDIVDDHQKKIMDIQGVLISSNSHKLKFKL